ncbi:formylglycine-generating enzyme family protein [Candidatus Uabimicrobium sp. HlEnr_7]|uniref:formylglycine-generating enzyme family protein n=1 Tax=Candidatus Uabimicrobium helgolandensis TaxID=3095367 RepID=UPI003558E7B3
MHGNIYEWCSDWYGEYDISITVDPVGPNDGSYRVIRGGSWFLSSRDVRSACRNWIEPDNRAHIIGFRFCLRSQ